jgi:hypothetical protein
MCTFTTSLLYVHYVQLVEAVLEEIYFQKFLEISVLLETSSSISLQIIKDIRHRVSILLIVTRI